jgi:serine-type D-Ala-D-Ala carboxypeptidase
MIQVILDLSVEIRKHIVRGEAHERVAYKYGGVAGHSGLFTTGEDLTKFMRILLNKGKLP